MNTIKSNISEKVKINDYEYIITYIDIENFSFVKRIEIRDESINNKFVCIRIDESGKLAYGSVDPGTNFELTDVEELNDNKKIICKQMLSQFEQLIDCGKYTDSACEVFMEVKEKFEKKKFKEKLK